MSTATQPLAGTFAADPIHSSFQFAVKHMKVATFRAGFDDVEARLVAGDDGVALEGRAKVDSVSVTNPPELRAHLVESPDFFDGINHTEITFTSKRVDLAEDGTATVDGELTIKGITKPVELRGRFLGSGPDPYGNERIGVELEGVVDRKEFGLEWNAPLPGGGFLLPDDVTLKATFAAVKAA